MKKFLLGILVVWTLMPAAHAQSRQKGTADSKSLTPHDDSHMLGICQTAGCTFSGAIETNGGMTFHASGLTSRLNYRSSFAADIQGATYGIPYTVKDTGGLVGSGFYGGYYSSAIGPGFDVAQTWYGHFNPKFAPVPALGKGHILGTTMTVEDITSGTYQQGMVVGGAGIHGDPYILRQLEGTKGGIGTYQLSLSQDIISDQTLTGSNGSPAEYGRFTQILCANNQTVTFGCAGEELNTTNRGPDAGFKRARSDLNVGPENVGGDNPSGGYLFVPEASVIGDGGGGTGRNVTYAYSVARSSDLNTDTIAVYPKSYTGYLVEPDSIVGSTGRGIMESGHGSTKDDATDDVPWSPLEIGLEWHTGIRLLYGRFDDGNAIVLSPGRSIANYVGSTETGDKPPSLPTAAALITPTGSGNNAGWNLTTAGKGMVAINGSPILIGSGVLEIDTFKSSGTWVKNSNARLISLLLIGGGSSGGGGTTAIPGTVYSGGAGGSAGDVVNISGPAANFPPRARVNVCSAAAGGMAGEAGTTGGDAKFETYVAYGGGAPSAGGRTISASGGSAGLRGKGRLASGSSAGAGGMGGGVAGASGAASATPYLAGTGSAGSGSPLGIAPPAAAFAPYGPSGGGAGAGMAATQAQLAGANSGSTMNQGGAPGGITAGANGAAGGNLYNNIGIGGGGGANNPIGAGGNGGAGGYGAGGGGGGDGRMNGGSGGAGGACLVEIIQQ